MIPKFQIWKHMTRHYMIFTAAFFSRPSAAVLSITAQSRRNKQRNGSLDLLEFTGLPGPSLLSSHPHQGSRL